MNITMEPCWKYVGNNPVDQIKYIKGEADEALEAALNIDFEAADLEVGDVMQACVTYFRGRGYNQAAVDELTEAVHRKNAERGYYKRFKSCDTCTFNLCVDRKYINNRGCDRWRTGEKYQFATKFKDVMEGK